MLRQNDGVSYPIYPDILRFLCGLDGHYVESIDDIPVVASLVGDERISAITQLKLAATQGLVT